MKKNQEYIVNLIQKFLRDDLTALEQETLDQWLSANERNRDLLEMFRSAKHIEADLEFLHALDEGEAWQKIQRRRLPLGYRKWLAIASAAAIFVGFFLYGYFAIREPAPTVATKIVQQDVLPAKSGAVLVLGDGSSVSLEGNTKTRLPAHASVVDNGEELVVKPNASTNSVFETNVLKVPKASFFKLVLSDGTKVWVNAMSELKFPVRFSAGERRVTLDGEAYFEVSHDPNRPFLVESKGIEVKVLGTHFNVNAYTPNVRTTLSSGKVQVRHEGDSVYLDPGDYASFSRERIFKGKADLQHDLAWHNNEFFFKKETIVDIASQLSRWYDLDVRFQGNVAFDKEYTGSIQRDVKLSQVLEMLSYVSNLRFRIEGKQLTIEEGHS